jgi:hypothetical protein
MFFVIRVIWLNCSFAMVSILLALHRPYIDHTSTSRRPHIDHTSTIHRPHIDPTSTLHRSYIDPTSTLHRPYIDPTSTLHRPYIDPYLHLLIFLIFIPLGKCSIESYRIWCRIFHIL